jgi:flagellar hook-associated protein 3 FlgL
MGALRVTSSIMVMRVLDNISDQTRRILELQEQLSTGRRVNSPSDDPIAARRAINTRTLIEKNEQYISNITAVGPHLLETDTSISTVLNFTERARELALQAGNDTVNQEQLNALALEVDQLLEGTLVTANHVTNGRYIFGGTRTLQAAFDETRGASGEITTVAYQGNTDDITVTISDGVQVTVNDNGEQVFQADVDIFESLIGLRDDLRAGDRNSIRETRITELTTARDQLLRRQARIGSVQNRLDRTEFELEDFNLQFEELLSRTVDADFSEVIVNLNAQQNSFQAALNAGASVIQPSLMDFVR